MRLQSLSYDDDSWHLQDLQVDDVSLLVGKNATGKSKALALIDRLAKIITQRSSLQDSEYWHISFLMENGQSLKFEFKTIEEDKEVTVEYERVRLNERVVLNRPSRDKASLYNSANQTYDEVNPPFGKLVVHVSRDVKKYPWIEEIAKWGEQSYGFKFGNIGPDRPIQLTNRNYFFNPLEDLPELFNALSTESKNKILADLYSIGFNISLLTTLNAAESKFIIVQEKGVEALMSLTVLSQGLYRCIALLIFLEYLVEKQKPSMVAIDDLCEGLDYERATKLGKLVFEKCLKNKIQLIATSNDMFLMDVVDLKYWNVLYRKDNFVHCINSENRPNLFKDFKFTGLSNFDFFSSDYIPQNKEE